MKYVVIYQSESGNTKKIAEEIYESISSDEKEIYDLDWSWELPEADVYFVGFGIHNGGCSMDVINCFEQISGGRIALFATCGFLATELYKQKLEKQLEVWLPEDADYLGMFLCQGCVKDDKQRNMINNMSDQADNLIRLFEIGSTHPDAEDIRAAANFAREIQRKTEHNGNIPIW